MTPRSYLFVPGNRPERFAKAYSSGADAVIIDLEDAVPPGERVEARARIAEWLSPEHPVLIRVNGANTEWFAEDIALCGNAGVAGVVLPKAEYAKDIASISHTHVLPIIESARGFWNVSELAHAPAVRRLIFGHLDFQLDMGIHGEGNGGDALLYFRSQLVLVSRIAGLPPPVDGITAAFDSPEPVRTDMRYAIRLGFGGKLCIHPKQIAPVKECFAPTAEEVAWAKRVMEATAGTAGEAISLDGRMIDRPVVARAEEILHYFSNS
jgi:citrate lyase subunit beta/citryl-CoA lyase